MRNWIGLCRKGSLIAGLALFALPVATWAQTAAAIVGTVTDRTGAVVAGARVTAVHGATNNTYTASTNERGDYRIDLRQLGSFRVRVEMASFKSAVFNNVTIEVGQTARLDAFLALGEVAESVTVEDASPLVRTETASIGEVIDSRKILELPLKGREFIQLATLMPGVASRNPNGVGQTQGATIEVNGQRGNSNNYRLNGLSNVSSTDNTQSSAPPLDAVQEFQIIRNMYSVEFGRAQGAVIDVRTKSGTNALHGSAYEFLRNSALDARQYFARIKPGFTYNQYGGSIGGPVVLPKLYNGRNKTFFFFAYEGLKDRRGTTLLWGVPTAAEKRGDFSRSLQPAPRAWRAGTVTGGPYADGVIPSTSFSPTGKIIMEQMPEPNYPAGGLLNFIASNPQPVDAHRYIVRFDQKIKSDSLFLTISPTRQNAAQKHPLFSHSDSTSYSDGGQYVLGYTHTFSPMVLGETRVGTAYSYGGRDLADKTNYAQKWGFPFFPTNPAAFGVPRIQVQLGAVVLGEIMGHSDAPSVSKDDAYNLVQQFIIVRKNHYLKAGGDINYERFRTIAGYGSRGVYRGGLNYSGNSWADMLLGLSSRSWYQPQTAWVRLDRPLYAFYIQDDWKIHPRVTLNIGVRYDYNQAWRSRDKLIAGFDLSTGQVVYAAGAVPEAQRALLQYPARFDGSDRAYNAYKRNWAPRLGLAWRPFGGNKTVVRSGYGIFYASPRGGEITSAARLAPWLSYLRFSEGNATTPLFFDRVPPGINEGVFTDPGTLFPNDPNRRDSYTQHWNFGVEREVLKGLAIETSYVGNRSAHLSVGRDANFFAPRYIGKPRYLPFSTIQWASNGFDSIYHALQVKATQRFSNGLSYLASYTWGKALNNVENSSGFVSFESQLDGRAEWGRGQQDVRHLFTLAGIYEIPVGRGRRYLTSLPRAVEGILGGWKLNYIFEANTGYPFNISDIYSMRPSIKPGQKANLPPSQRTRDRWFDPSVFQWETTGPNCNPLGYPGCPGNLGRNVMDGPGYQRADLGISKIFAIREGHNLEFRTEMFNATNHANLFMRTLEFGRTITSQVLNTGGGERLRNAYDQRSIQFGLRYSF